MRKQKLHLEICKILYKIENITNKSYIKITKQKKLPNKLYSDIENLPFPCCDFEMDYSTSLTKCIEGPISFKSRVQTCILHKLKQQIWMQGKTCVHFPHFYILPCGLIFILPKKVFNHPLSYFFTLAKLAERKAAPMK